MKSLKNQILNNIYDPWWRRSDRIISRDMYFELQLKLEIKFSRRSMNNIEVEIRGQLDPNDIWS